MSIMSLTEIMDTAIEILRKYIKTVLLFSLAYGVILIFILIGLVILGSIIAVLIAKFFHGVVLITIGVSIVILFLLAVALTAKIGMIQIASQMFLKERVYVDTALKASFKCMFKVLGIVTAAGILFLPIMGGFGAAGYFLYTTLKSSMILFGTYRTREIVLILLSILLIFIAALVLLAYCTLFSFSLHAITIEGKGVFSALKRSYQLVKNNFWKLFGSYLLFYLTIYAINGSLNSLLAVMSSIVYFFLKFLNVQLDYSVFLTLVVSYGRWPLNILSWLVISPVVTIMVTLMYFNQRFKKEGYDIVLKLREIQKNEERKGIDEDALHNTSN